VGQIYVSPTRADRAANIDYAMTLQEIADIEGVSRQAIEQAEKRALAKLRRYNMPDLLLMQELAVEMRRRGGHTEYGVLR
jgi:Sigma-70, region 4